MAGVAGLVHEQFRFEPLALGGFEQGSEGGGTCAEARSFEHCRVGSSVIVARIMILPSEKMRRSNSGRGGDKNSLK